MRPERRMNVTAYWDDGTEETRFVAAGSNDDGVYTFDTSPDVVPLCLRSRTFFNTKWRYQAVPCCLS